MTLHSIHRPTLIINESIARKNINMMAEKARRNNVSFEPHFKTHQSKEVGEWFREEGVDAITVSSLTMAEYFSATGWNYITIAFPVNILEFNRLNELASKASLTLLVQDLEVIYKLDLLDIPLDLLIEIDAGYHRTGVDYNSRAEIEKLILCINNSKNRFKGFYYHAGNSYNARTKAEIIEVYKGYESKMNSLKNVFQQYDPHIAIGDTPTCSVLEQFNGIDSIHPGNFVYYDYTQVSIGSCKPEQIATYLLCPVVAKNSKRKELIIYGGGVHLSKDRLTTENGVSFGLVGYLNEENIFQAYPDSFVKSVSQEHGIISSSARDMSLITLGDIVAIVPIHSCMTVDCMNEIFTEKGEALSKLLK